jgi:nucleoside-diphosphate-sugar epimerase
MATWLTRGLDDSRRRGYDSMLLHLANLGGMHTILGAGGAIGIELVSQLAKKGLRIRLVGRNPQRDEGADQVVAADLADLDQTVSAVAGSEVVYLLVGLKYDLKAWRELWPRIMTNAIEACKRSNAKLLFFDNVYAYGKVVGPMTERTPFNPCSGKGEIRARIATTLLNEMSKGSLTALIARSPDFYGPRVRTSVANRLVFDKFAQGAAASWLVNDTVRHSWAFTPDAGKGLALLAQSDSAWNRTWHVPVAPNPPTGKEFIEIAANAFGIESKYRLLSRPLIKLAGFVNADVRESYEMLYQYDSEYLFDSTHFSTAFRFSPTSYEDGIRGCAIPYTLGTVESERSAGT